jgi:ABC-type sulfate transport system permease component
VVVSSRLQEMDLSLEEAAMDLGASRLTVFTASPCRSSRRRWWRLAAGLHPVAG